VSEAVSPEEFHDRLFEICGLDDIHDYYGMVEQTGCIYMQCECGHLHASIFSDVIIRRHRDFSVADLGEKGIVQVVSAIPESYPGHSLLTEDEGVILGEDDCPCGRKGKYFKIFGRLKNAEIRGCSDTYAEEHGGNNVVESGYDDLCKKVIFLIGDNTILSAMSKTPPKQSFDDTVIDFLNELSRELMKSPEAKAYSDIVSYGFWIRKGSISSLKERFSAADDNFHVGRGVAFHVAPSNVPVNFAYSMTVGLITGNANVVRVPSKDFPQVGIICKSINVVLERFPEMKPYICLVRYERNKEINDTLSQLCDTRVVWGGDGTIAELRKSPLPPRATEITFADRYSFAVIDSDEYMASENKDRIASDFFNDTYLTDQNACTSPRVVVWTGNRRDEAKNMFWGKLHGLVEEKYKFLPVMAVDKLTQGYLASTAANEIGHICIEKKDDNKDNLLIRVKVEKLTPKLMDYRGNCGFFYEYDCENISELRDFCDDTHCQTIGVLGNKEILRPLVESGIKGVDRIAAIGHTMDFDLNWDGYNLVERLTRTVVI
jgi:hypothetical protein